MRRGWLYILDGHTPVPVKDAVEWALNFDDEMRVVAQTQVSEDIRVSTVFLGVDLGFGPPQLFETMIFGGPHGGYQKRYETWDQAMAGHQKAIEKVFEVTQ